MTLNWIDRTVFEATWNTSCGYKLLDHLFWRSVHIGWMWNCELQAAFHLRIRFPVQSNYILFIQWESETEKLHSLCLNHSSSWKRGQYTQRIVRQVFSFSLLHRRNETFVHWAWMLLPAHPTSAMTPSRGFWDWRKHHSHWWPGPGEHVKVYFLSSVICLCIAYLFYINKTIINVLLINSCLHIVLALTDPFVPV